MSLIKADCGQCDLCKKIWIYENFKQLCECCGGMFCRSHLREHNIQLDNIFVLGRVWICDRCIVQPDENPMTGRRDQLLYLGQPLEQKKVVESKIVVSETAMKVLTKTNEERREDLVSERRKRANKEMRREY